MNTTTIPARVESSRECGTRRRQRYLALGFAIALAGVAADFSAAQDAQKTAAADPRVLKLDPTVSRSAVLARPDSDVVEFSDGRRMRVGELRRLEAWGKRARSTAGHQLPAALRAKPAPTGRQVDNAAGLVEALKRPDSETVRLPSGRLATLGQIKFVMPKVEESLGRPLSAASKRPNLSGPALKVTAQSDWKEILQRPNNTVLEAPDGQRITVGELKQALQTTTSTSRTRAIDPADAPSRPAPAPAPKQR
jgi:hypothetical protein